MMQTKIRHKTIGQIWSDDLNMKLITQYDSGLNIHQLSIYFKRTPLAIEMQLSKLYPNIFRNLSHLEIRTINQMCQDHTVIEVSNLCGITVEQVNSYLRGT